MTGSEALAPGPNVVRMEFRYDGGGLGKGGTVTLFVNDKKVGEGRIEDDRLGTFLSGRDLRHRRRHGITRER